jgi:Domain of unknown function (DUF1707)
MNDDAIDGRPWPVDPIGASAGAGRPHDGQELDDAAKTVAQFADSVERSGAEGSGPVGTPPDLSGLSEAATVEVTDKDRHVFGALLDRAAERGLLNPHDYELRLGELASATSLEQMREIVTDFPMSSTAPSAAAAKKLSKPIRGSSAADAMLGMQGLDPMRSSRHSKERNSPWLLLGIVLVVFVVVMVLFSIYAEHTLHSHPTGLVVGHLGGRLSSLAPRLVTRSRL